LESVDLTQAHKLCYRFWPWMSKYLGKRKDVVESMGSGYRSIGGNGK
jgi:hypothetical protein